MKEANLKILYDLISDPCVISNFFLAGCVCEKSALFSTRADKATFYNLGCTSLEFVDLRKEFFYRHMLRLPRL